MIQQAFVKIRGQGKNNKYRKMLSTNERMYNTKEEEVHSSVPYTPGAVVEEGEWFKIEGFSNKEYASELESISFDSVDYELLKREEYDKIDYMFVEHEGVLYFQNVTKSKLIKKKGMLWIGGEYRYLQEAEILTVNQHPDAIYVKEEDSLYFKNLRAITGIFRGIAELYREATEQEVEGFLGNEFIVLVNEFTSSHVKIPNRRRIALAADTLSRIDKKGKKDILLYIRQYCPNIVVGNKIQVGSEDDLRLVLYGIEQRFYTTIVGAEKRVANSVIPLPNQS